MLAVTNDQFRPPINIQNGRNKQPFDTYAFTINIVPLVLEKTCFVGQEFEYKWKINEMRNQAKRNANSTPKSQVKAHEESGPSTDVGRAQAHLGTDHTKAVARRPNRMQAHLGAAAPSLPPLRPTLL